MLAYMLCKVEVVGFGKWLWGGFCPGVCRSGVTSLCGWKAPLYLLVFGEVLLGENMRQFQRFFVWQFFGWA